MRHHLSRIVLQSNKIKIEDKSLLIPFLKIASEFPQYRKSLLRISHTQKRFDKETIHQRIGPQCSSDIPGALRSRLDRRAGEGRSYMRIGQQAPQYATALSHAQGRMVSRMKEALQHPAPRRMSAQKVPRAGKYYRFVHHHPMLHPVAKTPGTKSRIVRKPVDHPAVGPATPRLQCPRKIPVIKRNPG